MNMDLGAELLGFRLANSEEARGAARAPLDQTDRPVGRRPVQANLPGRSLGDKGKSRLGAQPHPKSPLGDGLNVGLM